MGAPKKPPLRDRSEGGVYQFEIDAYTPQTIPMSRLAQYMGELAALLGEKNAVHFSRLTEGSTILNARVDREAAPKVRKRIEELHRGDAGGDALRAFKALNKLLRDDNAIGSLRSDEPEGLTIPFRGRELAEEVFTSVNQHGSIDGIITGVRGKDETIHVTLQSEGVQISGCETNRLIAKQLGARLFEPVRLFGRGRWTRDADGVWTLLKFRIESFETLDGAPLTTALAALRSVPAAWDDESFNDLLAIRRGPGGKRHGGH